MSDIWGKGGLFEQAIARKMELQGAQADSARENAAANTANVANQYDLGLRGNEVARGQLDVNRGTLGVNQMNAKTNQQNANTNLFNAETTRLTSSGGIPVAQSEASNLGLRTFNPVSDSAFNSFVEQRNAAIPSIGQRPQSATPTTGSASRPTIFRSGSNFSDREGMRNGGMVLKPKMVKQPGYMNGGKVKMPNGYKTGGKIGDVAKDDGTDKVEVVAREGEYFLNPETVAHIGGGDYSKGVRNLDNLVRQATGKEPGPVPVGKDKQGLNLSGATVDPADLRPEFRNVVGETIIETPQQRVVNPNVGPGRASAEAKAYRAAQIAAAEAPKGPGMAARAAQSINQVLDMNAGDAVRKGVDAAGRAVGATKDAVAAAARNPLVGVAGKVAVPVGLAAQAYDTATTPTEEYYRRTGIDPTATHVPQIMKDMGVRALGTLQDIGNTATFGLADRFGNLAAGNGFTRSSQYQDAPAAAAPPQKTAENAPPASSAGKDAAGQAAAQPAPPSLRDMMMARLGGIDAYTGPFASMVQRGMQGERGKLIDGLMKLEEQAMQTAGARANASNAAGAKHIEDSQENVRKLMQSPKMDDKGNITGYFEDPTKVKAFNDYMAQLTEKDGETPFNFLGRSRTEQNRLLQDFSMKYDMMRRMNDRLQSEGVSATSNKPRVDRDALRTVLDKDGKPKGITIGDVGKPGIGLGDWLTSFGWDEVENQMAYDPVTDQYVASRHIVGNNRDIQEQLLGAAGLRKPPQK